MDDSSSMARKILQEFGIYDADYMTDNDKNILTRGCTVLISMPHIPCLPLKLQIDSCRVCREHNQDRECMNHESSKLCSYCYGNITLGHCGGPKDHLCPCCQILGCALYLSACDNCGEIEKPCEDCLSLARCLDYERGDCCDNCVDEDLDCIKCGSSEFKTVECPSNKNRCHKCDKYLTVLDREFCWTCLVEDSYGFVSDLDLKDFPDLSEEQRKDLNDYIEWVKIN